MTTATQTRKLNIRLIAVEIGDGLKYDTSINEINRIGQAIFPFQRDHFPNGAITSQRAHLIHDWILSSARYKCSASDRTCLLATFVERLAPEGESRDRMRKILRDNGLDIASPDEDCLRRFDSQNFHSEIVQHCRRLYGQRNYFHAVFEASKVYNNLGYGVPIGHRPKRSRWYQVPVCRIDARDQESDGARTRIALAD